MFGSDQNQLTITLALQDSFSKELDKAKENLNDFSLNMKKVAAVGTVAFTAFAAIGIKSIQAFSESQKEMAIATKAVDNALEAMSAGGLNKIQKEAGIGADIFDHVKKKMNEVGKAAIKLGYDDESASVSFAKLFQISGDVSTAQKDLKLAMDLSAFSGRSLEETTKAIAMTYAGGGRVLKEFGLQIDENATAQDILAEANKKVGGTAEELSKTYAKQAEILQIQFGNLQETIGSALAPALTKILEIISPLIQRFSDWAEANPELLANIVLIGGAVSALVAGVGLLGMALPGIIAGFGLLSAPVLIVAGIVTAFIGTIYALNESFKILQNDSGLVWDGIKIMLKDFANVAISTAEAFANGWVMAINMIIRGLNKIQVSIPDWVPKLGGKSFGINISEVSQVSLPRFEHGGIVPGAQGESVPIMAHGQERIIPSSQSGDGLGNKYIYNVIINNPNVRNQSDINTLRAQVDEAMRDLIRVHKLQTI